jgi:hypothetical protein
MARLSDWIWLILEALGMYRTRRVQRRSGSIEVTRIVNAAVTHAV